MFKKILKVAAIIACGALIITSPLQLRTKAFASEGSVSEASETTDEDNSSASKAVVIIVVLAVFTVSCAGSAIITYKMRRKTLNGSSNNALDKDDC